MSTLTLLLIRLAFLAVLWLFVITAVGVVRTDLFGQSPASRKQKRQRQNARPRNDRPADRATVLRSALGEGETERLGLAIGVHHRHAKRPKRVEHLRRDRRPGAHHTPRRSGSWSPAARYQERPCH